MRRFQHFTQHGQGFLEVKKQLFTTFGFSAAGPQSHNIFAVLFSAKKISAEPPILNIDNF
jgi:hypothetical protein